MYLKSKPVLFMISFSVIIPNYNHAAYLEQRLHSVFNQTYPGFEVIILDDCSTDNSREIIEGCKSHDKVSHIIYNEKNSGSPFLQWKKGIELAKNDWIWIAESDDFADPSFLETAAKAISQSPSPDIFYSDSLVVDEDNDKPVKKFSTRKNEIFKTSKWSNTYFIRGIDEVNGWLKFDCTINNISSAVFRKELFTGNSSLLDGFKYYGDWFFLLHASLQSNIYYTPGPLNYYRKHGSSLLNSETSLLISRSEYFKILQFLYYNENITNKEELLDHFAYHYLSFGLNKDGLKMGWRICRSYLKIDRHLARKVIKRLISIKLFRRKRPFFVPVRKSN